MERLRILICRCLRFPALESNWLQSNISISWHFVMNFLLIIALLWLLLFFFFLFEVNWYILSWVSFIRCSFKSKSCMLLQSTCTSRPDCLEQSNQIKSLQAMCCEGSNQSQKRAKSPTKPFPSLTFPLTGKFSLQYYTCWLPDRLYFPAARLSPAPVFPEITFLYVNAHYLAVSHLALILS